MSQSVPVPVPEEIDKTIKRTIKVLLIDDQPMVAQAIKMMLQDEKDVEFYYCQDPEQALQEALSIKPTVILQDLVMPGVHGLSLVKQFRLHEETKAIPMIVLSSQEESDIKYQAFTLGANDYMVKLPHKLEVIARIRYHSKAYIRFLQRNKAYEELLKSQAALQKELDEAAHYVYSLLPKKIDLGNIQTDWVYIASSDLGGDSFGYQWYDEDHFIIYLLDVCGHGVGAALLSTSVLNVLGSYSLSSVDYKDPSSVISGLNLIFDMSKHNDMYFTLWYSVYNKQTRELKYASAGHPPAVLVHERSVELLQTENMVVGTSFEIPYQSAQTKIPPNSSLYVFSDGVYEINDLRTSSMMTFEAFVELIQQHDSQKAEDLQGLVKTVQSIQGKIGFDDDFSIIKVAFERAT